MSSSSSPAKPVVTASEPEATKKNPWRKSLSHFEPQWQDLALSDGTDHHRLFRVWKKDKKDSSETRKKPWILIQNTTVRKGMERRLNDLRGACADIMRFLINNEQIPKADVLSQDEKNEWPLSKEAEDSTAFFDYYEKNIYPIIFRKPPTGTSQAAYFYKGSFLGEMAGILYAQYRILLNDDMHLDNGRVKDGHFIGIDFDWCFPPVSAFLHYPGRVNVERIIDGQVMMVQLPRLRLLLPSEAKCKDSLSNPVMPTPDAKDFDAFPLVFKYVPNLYSYNNRSMKPYCVAMREDQASKVSRCIVALKALINPHIISMILKRRIEHSEDLAKILQIRDIESKAEAIELTKSKIFPSFLEHFNTYFLSSIICFFFELSEFFKENRHYLSLNGAENRNQYKNCVQEMLNNYLALLPLYKLSPPSEDQQKEVLALAEKIYANDITAIQTVKDYYRACNFTLRLAIVDKRIHKITKQSQAQAAATVPVATATASPATATDVKAEKNKTTDPNSEGVLASPVKRQNNMR